MYTRQLIFISLRVSYHEHISIKTIKILNPNPSLPEQTVPTSVKRPDNRVWVRW